MSSNLNTELHMYINLTWYHCIKSPIFVCIVNLLLFEHHCLLVDLPLNFEGRDWKQARWKVSVISHGSCYCFLEWFWMIVVIAEFLLFLFFLDWNATLKSALFCSICYLFAKLTYIVMLGCWKTYFEIYFSYNFKINECPMS